MKIIVAFLILFLAQFSFSQNIEISASPVGMGNYFTFSTNTHVGISNPRYALMASAINKSHYKDGDITKKLGYGIGISYVTFGGTVRSSGSEKVYPPYETADLRVHVIGLEYSPWIFQLGKHWNFRTGMFLGVVIEKDVQGTRTGTILGWQNGNPTSAGTTTEPVSESNVIDAMAHWNNRLDYKFNIKGQQFGAFFQVSLGLSNEFQTLSGSVKSYRSYLGLSWEMKWLP